MYRNALLSIALLVAIALTSSTVNAQRVDGSVRSSENQIFSLINRERARYGLVNLSWSDEFAEVARRYSQKMARERFFEHVDSDGNDVASRALKSRIRGWSRIGENLFMCSETPDLATLSIRGWMRSPGHRRNILDRGWRVTGVGVAFARNGDIYVTEVFAD